MNGQNSGEIGLTVILFELEIGVPKFLAVVFLALAAGACVPDQPRFHNDLAGYAPEQLKVAAQRSETPAHISTVAFKELGDSKRYAIVSRLVRETWTDACDPAFLQPNGYSPNGSSQWVVHCKGTVQARDYLVTFPELAKDNARVLKCHQVSARLNNCSIVGPAETASVRTASTM